MCLRFLNNKTKIFGKSYNPIKNLKVLRLGFENKYFDDKEIIDFILQLQKLAQLSQLIIKINYFSINEELLQIFNQIVPQLKYLNYLRSSFCRKQNRNRENELPPHQRLWKLVKGRTL